MDRNKSQIAENIIWEYGGIAKTSVLNEAGIKNYELSRLCRSGQIRRLRHGYYCLSEVGESRILSAVLPEGIVCMESALSFYGYMGEPDILNVAVPRSVSRSKLSMECIDFKPYYIRRQYLELGKSEERFQDVMLPVYDRERCICDFFRHRNSFDPETFGKVMCAYLADERKDLKRLSAYAKVFSMEKKLLGCLRMLEQSSRPFH